MKPESLDYTDEQLVEFFTYPTFGGFTAATCGACKATANVMGGAGWFCECGHYNILPWSNMQIPFDNPTYGPSEARLQAAIAESRKRPMKQKLVNNINIQKIRSKRGFRNGEPAYDVREIGKVMDDSRYFELNGFDDNGVDYYDAQTGRSVMSIGVRQSDGKIIASLMGDLYMHPDFKCIWLR